MKFSLLLRYALGRNVIEFHEIRIGGDVIVTSFDIFLRFFFKNVCEREQDVSAKQQRMRV